MKKCIFVGVLVFTLLCSIGVAIAQERASGAPGVAIAQEQAQPQAEVWLFCIQDTEFTPLLEFNVDIGGYVRGQAILASDLNFPAPFTGTLKGSKMQFTIAYLNGGLRFYNITLNKRNVTKSKGTTWGVNTFDSTYYDTPHTTTFAPCP